MIIFSSHRSEGDCSFKNGSEVAVVLLRYAAKEDSHDIIVREAEARKMTVYFGLPKIPYIGVKD